MILRRIPHKIHQRTLESWGEQARHLCTVNMREINKNRNSFQLFRDQVHIVEVTAQRKIIFPCWKTSCQKKVNEPTSVKYASTKARDFAFNCDPDIRRFSSDRILTLFVREFSTPPRNKIKIGLFSTLLCSMVGGPKIVVI